MILCRFCCQPITDGSSRIYHPKCAQIERAYLQMFATGGQPLNFGFDAVAPLTQIRCNLAEYDKEQEKDAT
jgi:hypothetical protein